MSQEARLKLRMQKELKLLLADPPHGASFPFLSSNSDITDLCSIDAQIEGPEDTVYSKGFFKIKIQIPERYPLQPPNVTFATPIYHPNIDNGGRICLDILNLPPKGAWQPSLNISTVLTSIRLLLSEPNPDDGLMCEASREYKYNRQAFDHKARSMTEKYAKAGAGESSCSNQSTETKAHSTMVQGPDQEPNCGPQEFNPNHKRSLGVSQKLSLDSTSSNKKNDADQKVPNQNLSLKIAQMESKRKREKEDGVLNECNLNNKKVDGKERKLSLKTSDQCKDAIDNKEDVEPNYLLSLCQHPAPSGSSFDTTNSNKKDADQKVLNHDLSITQMESKRKREKENDELNEYNPNNKKVHGKGLKTSDRFKDDFDNKENVDPNHYLSPLCRNQQPDQNEDGNSANSSTKSSSRQCRSQKQPFRSMESMQTCENVKVLGTVEESYVDKTENISANKKISSVGKKLSLGLKGSSHRLKVSNKENVMPIHSKPFSKHQIPGKTVLGRKLSLVPSTQQLQQDDGPNHKNQSHQSVQSMQTDVKVKEKGMEVMEEESSMSEKVVVLDSEESEGETPTAPSRTRMPLATRKRLGKWRV